jgi:hypothetical protein
VRLQPGNLLTASLHLRGEGVRYTGSVPGLFKKEVERFQQGVARGVVAEVEVRLWLEGSKLFAQAEARRARLLAHGNANHESMLREQMNERALRSPLVLDVAREGQAPAWLVLTGNHLVLGYGR